MNEDKKAPTSNVMPMRIIASKAGYYIKPDVLVQLVVSLHESALDESQDYNEYAQLRDGYADQLTKNVGVLGAVEMILKLKEVSGGVQLSTIRWLTNDHKCTP